VVAVAVLTSCSSSSTWGSNRSAGAPSLDEATQWYASATELVSDCRQGAAMLGEAITAYATQSVDSVSSVPIVMAAGSAAAACLRPTDTPQQQRVWTALADLLPVETRLLESWVDATDQVARASTVAAAGNLASKYFVTDVFDLQRRADDIAGQFEQRVVAVASSLGVDPPTGEILYHWNPPNH
jgi:hypothetical protein